MPKLNSADAWPFFFHVSHGPDTIWINLAFVEMITGIPGSAPGRISGYTLHFAQRQSLDVKNPEEVQELGRLLGRRVSRE
jgi:hypothetical protein